MDDKDILLTIQDMLDGEIWTVDMLDDIASLLHENGYKISDVNETLPTYPRGRDYLED